IEQALFKKGVTYDYLAGKLKSELNAKKSERTKLKGAVSQSNLPRGRKVIAVSGTVSYDQDGKLIGGDGETVIEWKERAWDIQQKARMDAQKLLNLYPAEKHDVTGAISVAPTLTEDQWAMVKQLLEVRKKQIIEAGIDRTPTE
ncbi:MAG: hypothetical protein ABID54_06425, partial [Pseudomonadota bacterium]